MPRHYCSSCRSPLHADDSHSKCVSCFGKSHAEAPLSLASLHLRISFFSESNSESPGTCEEKNSRAEDFSARLRASSRWLRSRVPHPHHTERFFLSSPPTWLSSLCQHERSGLVWGEWWQHVIDSLGRREAVGLGCWPRILAVAHAHRCQSQNGYQTSPYSLKSWD